MLKKLFPTLRIYGIDCEQNEGLKEVADKLNITAIPQLIVYIGYVEKMDVGVQRLVDIIKFLNIVIDYNKDENAIMEFLENHQ